VYPVLAAHPNGAKEDQMTDADLAFTPASKLREMVASRAVSPVELVELYLRRIERLNPTLNAYLTVCADEALTSAKAAEQAVRQGSDLGPLHGVPIAIKDLELTKGVRTTAGSLVFVDKVPDYDSIVVERVRKSGAVIIGKTNTPELGLFPRTENRLGPPCVNPWDTTRTVGGSSGGSAVALAAGLAPVAVGSDGGGSIRMPCSFTGTCGFKPTHGRIPRYGGYGKPAPNQFAQSGPMANTVRDTAILLQVLSGFDARDPGSLRAPMPDMLVGLDSGVKGLRVGWSADLGYAAIDPEVVRITYRAAKALAEQGAAVSEFALDVGEPWPPFWAIYEANSYLSYRFLLEERAADLTDYVREALEVGAGITGREYAQALRYVDGLRCRADELMTQYDLLVTPATAVPAFPTGQPPKTIAGRQIHSFWGCHPTLFPFNMTGQPAMSVPAGIVGGLPIGLQIIGRRGEDALALRAAAALEQALPWAGKRPPVS
jgi:Asp-tRNA(Asn)/Glu-tRNA(Gln) amidotransferase A subunit family amidase